MSSCTFRALTFPKALVAVDDGDSDDSTVVRNSTVVLSIVDVVLSDLILADHTSPLFDFDSEFMRVQSDVAVEMRNVFVSNIAFLDRNADNVVFVVHVSAFRVASAQVSQFLSQMSPGAQSVVRIDCLSQCGSLRFYNVTDTNLFLSVADVFRDVLVSNSHFSGGGTRLPAVSLHVTERMEADSQIGIHEAGNFSVEDSVFKGQLVGAVRFWGGGGLLNSTLTLHFSRCSFVDNDRGAVTLEFEQQEVLCTFESSYFERNRPELLSGAGALTVSSLKPRNVDFADIAIVSSVVLSNCTFVENPNTIALTEQSGHFLDVFILNSFFVATDKFDLPLIDLVAAAVTIKNTLAIGAPALLSAQFHSGDIQMDNTSMQCLRGWQALSRPRDGRIDVVCKECVDLHFNIGDQKLVFENGTIAETRSSVGCFNCPLGSRFNCSGGDVGAAPGFWAQEPNEPNETATLTFVKCPAHFCCDDALGCAAVDQCSHNRTSVLCGACAPGFTHAIGHHGECVELSVCSASRIAIGWLLLAAVCFTFTAFKARSFDASSDGILGVAASFSNIAQILLSDMLSLGSPSSPALTTLKQILSTLFALSGFTSSQGALALTMCPLPELSSLGRLIAVGILMPTLLLLSWVAISLFLWVRERRQQSDLRRLLTTTTDDDDGVDEDELPDASLPFRVAALGLSLFDFSFFTLATTSLAVLNTIDVPDVGCRLWRAGDVPCSGALQAGGVTTFLIIVSLPFVFALVQHRWPRAPFSKAVRTVQQSPFRSEVAQFNLVLIARRVILALAFALVQDGELRAIVIRATLVACLALHLQVAPFASAGVNRLEAIALSGLVLVSLVPGGAMSPYQGGMHIAQLSVLTITLVLLVGLSALQKWRGRAFEQKMSKK